MTVDACHQAVTPEEADHLDVYNTAQTRLFSDLYARTGKAPVVLRTWACSTGSLASVEYHNKP